MEITQKDGNRISIPAPIIVVILGLIIGLFTYSFLGQVSASKDRDNQISGRVDKLETKIDNLQASVSQIGADVSGIRGALKIK